MTDLEKLEKIEAEVDAMVKRIQRFHLEHDDGVAGDDHGKEDQPTYSYGDLEAARNGNSNGDGDPEEDDDEEDKRLRKAFNTNLISRHDEANRPGSLPSTTHPQSRHKFEALANKIRNENGIPKSAALARARLSSRMCTPLISATPRHPTATTSSPLRVVSKVWFLSKWRKVVAMRWPRNA